MPYINTEYLFKCETCRHCVCDIKCNTFCDSGESYSPNMNNIPSADVVPRERFDRVFGNLKAVLEERSEDKAEVAREIFEEIDKLHIHVSSIYDANRYAELKKKYTGDQEDGTDHARND